MTVVVDRRLLIRGLDMAVSCNGDLFRGVPLEDGVLTMLIYLISLYKTTTLLL